MTRRTAVLLAGSVLLASCGDTGGPPTPPSQAGDLQVSYFNGGTPPGAMLIAITGGAVQSVTARPGQAVQVSWAATPLGTTRVLVTGLPVTGELLTIRVPDTTLATSYRARVEQVADNLTFVLLDPSGNTLTVHH